MMLPCQPPFERAVCFSFSGPNFYFLDNFRVFSVFFFFFYHIESVLMVF